MHRNYIVAHFTFPCGYGNPSGSVVTFEPGCNWKGDHDINVEEFLFNMDYDHGFELISVLPVKVDPVGQSIIDFLFRSKDEADDQ